MKVNLKKNSAKKTGPVSVSRKKAAAPPPANPAQPAKAKATVRPHFPEEKRIRAVKQVLLNKATYAETARRFGCSATSVQLWVKNHFDAVKAAYPKRKIVFPDSPHANRFSEEVKAEAVALVLESGYSCQKAAQISGCESFMVRRWVAKYYEKNKKQLWKKHLGKGVGPDSWIEYTHLLCDKQIKTICRGMKNKTVQEKYAFVAEHRGRYSSRSLCVELGVSQSGFYQAYDIQPASRAQKREKLLKQIAVIHKKSKGQYGHQKIWEELLKKGYDCKLWLVRVLCRELGIYSNCLGARSHKPKNSK